VGPILVKGFILHKDSLDFFSFLFFLIVFFGDSVNLPVSEHLRSQRRSNPYFASEARRTLFCPQPRSNATKIAQSSEGMGKIWVFGVRGLSVRQSVNSNRFGFQA
jgi:hypothetical protein